MSAALARRGHHVDLVATNVDGPGVLDVPILSPIKQDGYTVTYFPVQRPRWTRISRPMLNALPKFVRDADVVDVHSIFLPHTFAATYLARRHRVPYVVRPHGTLDRYQRRQHRWRKWLYWSAVERNSLNRAAAIHYTSTKEWREAEEAGVRAPAYIIPLGVDLDDFSGVAGRSRREDQVLFLGRLAPKKGVDVLLRAWVQVLVARPAARLVIAGPDDRGLRPGLERLARELRIDRAVDFVGPVGGEQKLALLGSSVAFVLPSEDENFGIAVIEAMACGLPVVVTEGVALYDEILAADAGVVVRRDPEGVAAGIMHYLRNPGGRRASAIHGLDLVSRRFTWDACAAGLEAMYLEMLSRKVIGP